MGKGIRCVDPPLVRLVDQFRIPQNRVADYQRLRKDVTRTGTTLDDACWKAGLDSKVVADELQAFNQYVSGKCNDSFGRSGDQSHLEANPWVVFGPVKAYFTTTEGGAVVNERMQVLDEAGDVLKGLYAVGQNGLSGMVLWSHGLHIAWAMTSGRLAGVAVMEE